VHTHVRCGSSLAIANMQNSPPLSPLPSPPHASQLASGGGGRAAAFPWRRGGSHGSAACGAAAGGQQCFRGAAGAVMAAPHAAQQRAGSSVSVAPMRRMRSRLGAMLGRGGERRGRAGSQQLWRVRPCRMCSPQPGAPLGVRGGEIVGGWLPCTQLTALEVWGKAACIILFCLFRGWWVVRMRHDAWHAVDMALWSMQPCAEMCLVPYVLRLWVCAGAE
jgi:hypothetical protein